MTFYRVEKEGKGPYSSDYSLMEYLTEKGILTGGTLSPEYEAARPVPSCDAILSDIWDDLRNAGYVFGFAKFDDIFAWFNLPEEIAFFKEYGYKISTYEVKTLIKGSKQALAYPSNMVLVDTRNF